MLTGIRDTRLFFEDPTTTGRVTRDDREGREILVLQSLTDSQRENSVEKSSAASLIHQTF